MTWVPKVLIVEDDEQMRYVCRRMLSKSYEVTTVSSCDEGILRLRSEAYAAVLLDLKMAGMSPEQFLKTVKQEKPECPVIAMSGYPELSLISRIIQGGADDFLPKPFNAGELKSALERCLAIHPSSESALKGKKIFVVDDDDTFLSVFAMMLESRKAVVSTASTGEGALKALESERPDLIILDMILPGLSGYELRARIRANSQFVKVPIVLITGNLAAQKEDVGGGPCLLKSSSPSELLRSLEEMLNITIK